MSDNRYYVYSRHGAFAIYNLFVEYAPKSALVLSHIAFEDLGKLDSPLRQRGFSIERASASTAHFPLPQAETCELLVVLGGPIGVYDQQEYPFLNRRNRIDPATLGRAQTDSWHLPGRATDGGGAGRTGLPWQEWQGDRLEAYSGGHPMRKRRRGLPRCSALDYPSSIGMGTPSTCRSARSTLQGPKRIQIKHL